MADTQIYYDSTLTGPELDEALKKLPQVDAAVEQCARNVQLAQSWAEGGTGTRDGENTNNAQYWCNQAQTIAQGALGWYENAEALQVAHPTGQNGQWAIIGTTDTIWTWDSDTSAWVNSGTQIDLSNYYTKDQANVAFAPTSHAAAANTYGAATGSLYGHVRLSDTASASDTSSGVAATPKCVHDAAFYKPGDVLSVPLTITQVSASGLVTGGGQQALFTLPLQKSISPDVTSVTINSGTMVARGVKGYIIGGSGDYKNIADLVSAVQLTDVGIVFTFVNSSGYDTTNNTPAVASFYGLKLTFNG